MTFAPGPQMRARAESTAAICVGVIALLIAGLQPLLLGGLQQEGRLTNAEIGLTAMAEMLALGLSTSLASAVLKPSRIRLKIGLACLVHAIANAASMGASHGQLLVWRIVAGCAAGVMLWVTISTIARSGRPERETGLFVTFQTLAQLGMVALLSTLVLPTHGANGGMAAMSLAAVAAALIARAGPSRLAPLQAAAGRRARLSSGARIGLLSVFLFMSCIVSVWVYLEPLGARAGLSPTVLATASAVGLASQVAGGAVATALGDRISPVRVLIGTMTCEAIALATLGASTNAAVFLGAVAAFGFFWLFALPFQTALLVRIDPSRRGAMQVGAAQLIGGSAGPLAASLLVNERSVLNVVVLSAACLAAAIAFTIFLGGAEFSADSVVAKATRRSCAGGELA